MSKDAESYATTPSLRRYLLEAEFLEDGTVQQIRGLRGGKTPQRWEKAKSLGKGSFGQVRQERRKDETGDWHYRAVKVCARANFQRARVDFTRELSALAAFSSSKYSGLFVNLMGWWIDSQNLYIATEYVGRGDLSHYINDTLQENDAREIIEGTLNGLRIMHQQGFTHRDIKPQNILVMQKPPEFQRWWVKIADFGISKKIHEDDGTSLHTFRGTRPYCAPEILEVLPSQETSVYSNKVDIWSLGCVLFKISSHGYEPFSESELLRYCHKLIQFNPRGRLLFLGSHGESLLRTFLDPSPECRPSAIDALKHEWLTSELDFPDEDICMPDDSLAERSNETRPQQNYNSFLDATFLEGERLNAGSCHTAGLRLSSLNLMAPTNSKPPVGRERQDLSADSDTNIDDVEQTEAENAPQNPRSLLEAIVRKDKSKKDGPLLEMRPWDDYHRDYVRNVDFSPDGTLVASASLDKMVGLWNIETGETCLLKAHTTVVFAVAFSPIGQGLVSGSADRRLIFWNEATKERHITLNGPILQIAFSPDGSLLACICSNMLVLLDAATGERFCTSRCHDITCLVFSPDGKQLLVGSTDGTVMLWNLATGEEQRRFEEHEERVNSVAVSQDGKVAASGAWDKKLILWDIEKDWTTCSIEADVRCVQSVAFSPDGRLVASAGYEKTIKLWDVATRETLYTLTGHEEVIRSVVFSPDGRLLASGSDDRTVMVWAVPEESEGEAVKNEEEV